MNKLSFKNIFALSVIAVLTVGSFLVGIPQVSAEIPGRELVAGLTPADLSGIASKYPALFWTALIILIVLCAGYGIYYLVKRKKK